MKPFLLGRKTSAVPSLVSSKPKATISLPEVSREDDQRHSGPHVEVVKEGDKVVRMIVVCSCGERIEVECLYTSGK